MARETKQVSAIAIAADEEDERGKAQVCLYGDILQAIFSRLPLLHLVPASYVSKDWRRHVDLSLLASPRPHPWLLLHLHNSRRPAASTTYAFDPHSRTWARLPTQRPSPSSPLRSAYPALLYTLSPSSLSVSLDPLSATWVDLGSPRLWRVDPLVALVGSRHVVVAGGTLAGFDDDDPLAVEVYDAESPGASRTCQPMPAIFKNAASPVWLCAAASDTHMFLLEKNSGDFCALNVETGAWDPTTNLRADPSVYYSVIGYSNGRLIQVGLVGDAQNPVGLRIWEVGFDGRQSYERKQLGEMPAEMVERLKQQSSDSELASVEIRVAGELVYMYNPGEPSEIYYSDMAGGGCKWGSDLNPVMSKDGNRMGRFLFTCTNVRIDHLRRAYGSGDWEIAGL